MNSVVRQESATDFMLRKAHDFTEWLTIGDPRTMARIRECIRRYPKPYARHALLATCMSNHKLGDVVPPREPRSPQRPA